MKITAVGQATYYLEDGALTVLTDPWFSARGLSALFAPRLVPPALLPGQIAACSLILLSHIHLDHWDRPALELARRCKSVVVTSPGAARRLKRAGLAAVGLDAGECWSGLGVKVRAVEARHPLSPRAVGLVMAGRKTVYFSGDTIYHPALNSLENAAIDLALVQVSCARYPLLGPDGMDWPAAVSLVRRIKPRLFLPMHFTCKGKYLDLERRIRIEDLGEVKQHTGRMRDELSKEGIDCRVLWPGETLEI